MNKDILALRETPMNSKTFDEILDRAIDAYEWSNVVADRELELLVCGASTEKTSSWRVFAHNN